MRGSTWRHRLIGAALAGLLVVSAAVVAGAGAVVSAALTPAPRQRVELEHLRTETQQVFREPSGLHTLEAYNYPVRARRGKDWVPVDTSLKLHPDGSVRPGAILTDLRLSGGGDKELAVLGKAGKQIRLGWPGRLPQPVLAGDTATYPDLLPGVDLKVQVEATGIRHSLVVKNQAAAKTPALERLRLSLSGTGATKKEQQPAIEPAQQLLAADDDYQWTHVSAEHADQSYWNYDRGEGAKVGRSYDNVITYRSFVRLPTGQLAGSRIVDSRFELTLDHSSARSAQPTNLWLTHTVSPTAPVTWRSTAGHWRTHLATASGNANTAAGQPDMVMRWASDSMKSAFQAVADAADRTITFGLRAPSESEILQWKRFHGHTGKIVVTYNNAPYQPRQVNFTRARPCGTAQAPTLVSWPLSGYMFSAVANDKDGNNLVTRLTIRRVSDNTEVTALDSAPTSSGSAFAWPAIDRAAFTDGQTYAYSAKSDDGVAGDDISYGPASPECYFKVDAVKPQTAVLESADFPDGEAAIPARTVGTVTLQPSAEDTDVTEYLYGFRPERITSRIKAGPGGVAQLPMTVWQTPTGTRPPKSLYVLAVDGAGNVSDEPAIWELSASRLQQVPPPVRNDVNGDGRADLSAVLDQGEGRTTIWNVVAKGNGALHTGQLASDTGANGGFAMYRTRPVRGDFDGDGRTDVVLIREEAGRRIAMYRGLSDSERYNLESSPVWHSGPNGWPLSTARIVAGDVNADGKDDVVVQLNVTGSSWRALTFLGPALNTPVEWLQTPSPWSGSAPLLADVDGDNRADLVDMQNLGSCRTVTRYFKSTGAAFSTSPVTMHDSGTGVYCWERSKPQVADLNGDGKDDLVALYEHSATDMALIAFLSNGTSFSAGPWWRDTTKFDPARTALTTGDFNGDGKEDAGLLYSLDGGGREAFTLLSNGNVFSPAVSGWKEPRVGANTGPSFDIEQRTYELINRNSSRCLDVWLGSQTDAEKLVQHACHGGLNQRFRIKQIAGTDQYEIHTAHFQGDQSDGRPRCLDVKDMLHEDETTILQWPCMGTSNQQLRIEYLEGSSYDTVVRLKFAHSDKCASPSLGSSTEDATIVQRTCTAEASQQWILRAGFNPSQPDGKYRVRAVHGLQTLDVKNCLADEVLRMWEWVPNSPCQRWQFKPLGDDVYKIIEPSTGEALDVVGCTDALGLAVGTLPESESPCQRWRVEPAHNGSWSLTQERNGNSLDVYMCDPKAGAPLITYRYWNGYCQRFLLDQP